MGTAVGLIKYFHSQKKPMFFFKTHRKTPVSESLHWGKKRLLYFYEFKVSKNVAIFTKPNFTSINWTNHSQMFFKIGTTTINRTNRPQMFFKIGAFKNLAVFTGKHQCWSLFLIKLQVFRPSTLLKRRLLHRCLSVKFEKSLKTDFHLHKKIVLKAVSFWRYLNFVLTFSHVEKTAWLENQG